MKLASTDLASNLPARMAVAVVSALICGCAGSDSGPDSNRPVPKAEIDREYHDVGKIVVGQEVRREFTIANSGDAVLKFGRIVPTEDHPDCQAACDLSTREIPPGGSAVATVTVNPQKQWAKLRKGVYIETNDPNRQWLRIGIYAIVAPLLEFHTEKEQRNPAIWSFETGEDGEPIPFPADLYSAGLEKFEIVTIEASPDFVCRFRSLEATELAAIGAKSGYRITTEFANREFVGTSRGRIAITTNVPSNAIVTIGVKATRFGPLRVIPDRGSPWRWDRSNGLFALETFHAAKGTSAMARVYVSPPDEEKWTLESVACDIPRASVSFVETPTPIVQPTRRFELTLRIPPASGPAARVGDNPAHLVIETTHPQARRIRLPICYVSTR